MPDKDVLIFGDTGGLGASLVDRFGAAGWRIAGASRTAPDPGMDAYTRYQADVTEEKDIASVVSALRSAQHVPDIVVNCSGVPSRSPLLLTPSKDFQEVLAVNTVGAFHVAREFAKLMMAGGGLIVNFSSIHASVATVGTGAYASSKAAIEAMTRVMAKELSGTKVRVACIALSYVEGVGMAAEANASARDETLGKTESARLTDPDEVFGVLQTLFTDPAQGDEPVVKLGL